MGMEAKELIIATWVLVGFTGALALATIAYAITTWKLYRGSQRQIEALNQVTKGILQLPHIEEIIKNQKELQKIIDEQQAKLYKFTSPGGASR